MDTMLMETGTLDLSELLAQAYEVGDMINGSAEVADYAYWKRVVEADADVQAAVLRFERTKERFAETERFGHYHPNYHEALDEAKEAELALESFESVRRFKEAEAKLDDLLFTVSQTIAFAVSEDIKVPSNNPLPTKGCGSGGSCGCG
ncbi:YlbF family regulator [Paenibacillus koleovorans]|uniref:YlbF family regulator n=1 Tax=Paenibacillus koleovorans TaxID=121608 RepID=UPI000FD9E7E3|nr:YlbF family regulator [Paenibacillus koleovorans]